MLARLLWLKSAGVRLALIGAEASIGNERFELWEKLKPAPAAGPFVGRVEAASH
jgi:hypothetical protein